MFLVEFLLDSLYCCAGIRETKARSGAPKGMFHMSEAGYTEHGHVLRFCHAEQSEESLDGAVKIPRMINGWHSQRFFASGSE